MPGNEVSIGFTDMSFIGEHALVVFKNMSVKPIETLLPFLMNMVQKLTSQCTST